ncbi:MULTISPECIES: aspartate ammonia-lyase [unclassified Enterococcus]|uniref:aspartate ammonia-lyase n=1 Tax=unclassified Enterococcus TaxID=2608891 RepID=UPI0015580877|nr:MULTISPECIES: aspartate ammonia-lyase [unclassified Enterococcus]MBS7577806.1 aspartate ammonia-lyase [Enterococcus sp. MMGLQ5-2]MBS7585066.1 aspartate ammonia-lyase [Enterococcus sp. MMGLQ5-1]NPD12922.1 aspartate ammonia-lyase [Enterococcus sp. MMGLQ5-1]NPD37636.1 aspartate ammonia-lyase [Enterococcus sp. MMGLQ5-2]
MITRIETDSLGSKAIPEAAYYGIHTKRAFENFQISGQRMNPLLIKNMARIKKAAAIVHLNHNELSETRAEAIIQACDEIIEGKLSDQFILDAFQGGAGTSANMNVNEVIANRALEIIGELRGNYKIIHPNDHINKSQSTNDVYPTAGKMAVLEEILYLEQALRELELALGAKAKEFKNVIKVGRTQLQDALPTDLGDSFKAYQSVILRELKRIKAVKKEIQIVNLGGTAIGTSVNASKNYLKQIIPAINQEFPIPLIQSGDLIDATQNLDGLVQVSAHLKSLAVTLTKISNDLRLMSSGPQAGLGEIRLPQKQVGSSIMPGKVNPVIPEVVSQIAFQVIGNDLSITLAAENGQLELNAFEPVLFQNLLSSVNLLTNGIKTLTENAILELKANEAFCYESVMTSDIMITALAPFIGYEKSASLLKEARIRQISVREVAYESKVLPVKQLNQLLNPAYFIANQAEVDSVESLVYV